MCACVCGCGDTFWAYTVDLAKREPPPNPDLMVSQYDGVELKKSGAADVLSTIYMPKYELLSQSRSVIATAGTVKKDHKRWLEMVAFGEDGMEAQRKYLLIANERPRYLFVSPWAGVRIDMQMVLESEVIDEPYANENARRVAILKRMKEYAAEDFAQVAADDKNIETAGLIVSESLSSALTALETSPALAEKMTEGEGMTFSDLSLDKGLLKLEMAEDVGTVRMLLGSYAKCRIVLPPTDQY